MTEEKLDRAVWEYLYRWHFGQEAATPRRKVLEALNRKGLSVTDRALRLSVARLVGEGKPICTSANAGYWVAASRAELEAAANDLGARIRELALRRKALLKTEIPLRQMQLL